MSLRHTSVRWMSETNRTVCKEVGIRQGRMQPTSPGQQPSALIPKQAAVVETHGSWDWSTPHPISRLRSCKTLSLSAIPSADEFCDQRLLVFSSLEPSSWASGHDIHLGNLLSGVCHWLCVYSDMGPAFWLSPATRHWDGNQSVNNSSIRCRELTRFH